jgi:hypothetical protein
MTIKPLTEFKCSQFSLDQSFKVLGRELFHDALPKLSDPILNEVRGSLDELVSVISVQDITHVGLMAELNSIYGSFKNRLRYAPNTGQVRNMMDIYHGCMSGSNPHVFPDVNLQMFFWSLIELEVSHDFKSFEIVVVDLESPGSKDDVVAHMQ